MTNKKDRTPYIRKHICTSSIKLKEKFTWQVGKGNVAFLWTNSWFMEGLLITQTITHPPYGELERKIAEYWRVESTSWDLDKLR